MNPYFYIKTHSKERVQQVCELAGTKPTWFSLLARGHGECSVKMAIDLEAVSRELAELDDDYMTIEEIFNFTQKVNARREEIRQQLIKKYQAA